MTAPVASGWSGCRVGLAPTGKRRLSTAHTQGGHINVRVEKGAEAGNDPAPNIFDISARLRQHD
jgi:hypothetical protein